MLVKYSVHWNMGNLSFQIYTIYIYMYIDHIVIHLYTPLGMSLVNSRTSISNIQSILCQISLKNQRIYLWLSTTVLGVTWGPHFTGIQTTLYRLHSPRIIWTFLEISEIRKGLDPLINTTRMGRVAGFLGQCFIWNTWIDGFLKNSRC